MTHPPSTLSVCPVIASLSDEAKNTNAPSISDPTILRLMDCSFHQIRRSLLLRFDRADLFEFCFSKDRTWCKAIDSNTVFAYFSGQRTGQTNNGSFRGDIVGEIFLPGTFEKGASRSQFSLTFWTAPIFYLPLCKFNFSRIPRKCSAPLAILSSICSKYGIASYTSTAGSSPEASFCSVTDTSLIN